MSLSHPYRQLQLPSDAPISLKPSRGKGWGMFATEAIPRGSLILEEKPLFIIRKPHTAITEQDIALAFFRLTPSQQRQFQCLRDNADKRFTSFEKACAENSFEVESHDSQPPGHGIYLLLSRFNHSCLPNSKVPSSTSETYAIYATQDIVAGEEITFCYNPNFEVRTAQERHDVLRFICRCQACTPGTRFHTLSELRRRLIRGLMFLVFGMDIARGPQMKAKIAQTTGSSPPSIIIDPALKVAAETYSIPFSSMLIYYLLAVLLMEEEGLLDQFMLQNMSPGLSYIASVFATHENARIGRLVVLQKTWLEKLCVAAALWGRADAADGLFDLRIKLRMIQAGLEKLPAS